MRVAAGILIAVGTAACFSPSVHDGLPCGPGNSCPGGQSCDLDDGRCYRDTTEVDAAPDPDAGPCPAGFERIGQDCVDIDECVRGSDDCSADAMCANTAGGFTCTCDPGFEGDGVTCTRACTTVLIYDDCAASNADCAAIPEVLFADDAATQLGLAVLYGGVGDQPAFRGLFDAGGFDVLVVESSLRALDTATIDRIATWTSGGGKIVLSYWDLDAAGALATALEVTTGPDFTMPRDVVADPAAPLDVFDRVETIAQPLMFTNPMVDDGDELSTTTGFLAARHDAPDGPGAIAVTHGGRAIVLGFLPIGLVFQGPADGDADGAPDVQELYANLIGSLCAY